MDAQSAKKGRQRGRRQKHKNVEPYLWEESASSPIPVPVPLADDLVLTSTSYFFSLVANAERAALTVD